MNFFGRKKPDLLQDYPDLSGKVVIVTGANSGIGFRIVQQLLRKGATVYLGARNESRAISAWARLDAEGLGPGFGTVHWLRMDFSDPKDAIKAAQNFMEKEWRLDFLINNAAVLLTEYKMTTLGIQETMLVNHLSPFAFTQTLLPMLKRTATLPGSDVRIVFVVSHLYEYVPPDVQFKNRQDFNLSYEKQWLAELKRYGASKLANILYAKELQKQFDEDGVDIITLNMHPGSILTQGNIARVYRLPLSFILTPIALFLMRLLLYSDEEGARNILISAIAPHIRAESQKYKAAFIMPTDCLTEMNATARREDLSRDLWQTTTEVLKELGVQMYYH